MKYLIAALCVCAAASAAQISLRNTYQPYQPTAQAVATASASPATVTVAPFARNYQTGAPAVAKAYSSVVQPAVQAYGGVVQPSAKAYSSVVQPTAQAYGSVVQPTAKAYGSVVQPAAQAYSAVVQPAVVAAEQPFVQTYNAAKAVPVVVSKSGVHSTDAEAPIVKSVVDVAADGFSYAYETGNGIAAQQQGVLKKVDNVDTLAFEGSYQYIGPEGPVVISYIADENGYQPRGESIPTPPPVPVAILRALEWIASQPKPVETEYKKL